MKIIFLLASLILLANADTELKKQTVDPKAKYQDRVFYSVGMLGKGQSFVCIDGEKWLEKDTDDKIELHRIYIWDSELRKDVPMTCL